MLALVAAAIAVATSAAASPRSPDSPPPAALSRADAAWAASLTRAAQVWASAHTAPTPADYRAQAEAFLDTLPGGDAVTIEWGDPEGHLGGVWIPGPPTIILNAQRLDGRVEATQDVLRHEIAHVHQNLALTASGLSLAQYTARLDALFDGDGVERSADAVAALLGATTLRYQSEFTPAQLDAAREILADRVP
ncbi:hypothetical protein [Xylanimonas ulmi]|uniref:Peptidase M48-like protein n=1 Tax=Xylanimonas ulmi TaxID=228973 RepID=A0A4Q7M3J7_9MICO|nr:hypothetical protein [Xylanibacterium ulmi]RZS62505.1 hypothetical protein EV386_2841 [Xylanibacterium ulmi]